MTENTPTTAPLDQQRIPVNRVIIHECPNTPSKWGLWLEPIAGEAVCVIRFDVSNINKVARALRTVFVSD